AIHRRQHMDVEFGSGLNHADKGARLHLAGFSVQHREKTPFDSRQAHSVKGVVLLEDFHQLLEVIPNGIDFPGPLRTWCPEGGLKDLGDEVAWQGNLVSQRRVENVGGGKGPTDTV